MRRETWLCHWVIVGPVADGRPGILYLHDHGPPGAQFAIAGLEEVIDGLCVHRSGHNVLTRQPLPKGYAEVRLRDEEFSERFRVGVRAPESATIARSLLAPAFTGWLVDHGPQGNSLSEAGTFDVDGGVLFVRGDPAAFGSYPALDTFAHAAAGLADRVAAWVASAATPRGAKREKGQMMAADGSAALGAPELAGTLVNPKGYTKKTVARVAGGEIAGLAGSSAAALLTRGRPVPDLPDFGRVGYVAVSVDDVALIKTKAGLKMRPTSTVLARAPRSDLASAELDEGRLISHLRLHFTDGQLWEFDIPRSDKRTARAVVGALNGAAA
jgi:hypothetical protein